MKTLKEHSVWRWAYILILGLVPLYSAASVNVIHNNETYYNYAQKVIMRSTIWCPESSYYSTFTCEHYLQYGESLVFDDYLIPSGNSFCYYTYSVDSSTWISNGANVLSYGAFDGHQLLYSSSFTSRTEMATGPDAIAAWIGTNFLIQITPNSIRQWLLDQGCIGLYKIFCRVLVNGVYRHPGIGLTPPEADNNAIFGTQVAFVDLAKAKAYSCTGNTHKVLVAKYGKWKNGSKPVPANPADGFVDATSIIEYSAAHNYDYMIYLGEFPEGARWVSMNNGYERDPAKPALPTQKLYIWVGDPQENSAGELQGPLYIVRCIPNDP